jgi:hypothetical protein
LKAEIQGISERVVKIAKTANPAKISPASNARISLVNRASNANPACSANPAKVEKFVSHASNANREMVANPERTANRVKIANPAIISRVSNVSPAKIAK